MQRYRLHGPGEWVNYHENMLQWSDDIRSYCEDAPAEIDSGWFKASADQHKECLKDAIARTRDVRFMGGGWSLNNLLRTDGILVRTMDGAGVLNVVGDNLAPGAVAPPNHLVMASAGMRIHELNKALEERKLSLKTSGAHDGQSIAGAIATGAHGSVHNFGGIQDHVRGLHIVVSPEKSVWVEPQSQPALTDAFALTFADEVIRDDEVFSAATVHLGCMGIINAALLEVEDIFLVELIQRKQIMLPEWVDELQNGDFAKIAARLGFNRDVPPYYIQIIMNPYKPFAANALHRLLYKQPYQDLPPPPPDKPKKPIIGEPMNLIAAAMTLIPKIFAKDHRQKAFNFKQHIIEATMEFMYKEYPHNVVSHEDDDNHLSWTDWLRHKKAEFPADALELASTLFDDTDDNVGTRDDPRSAKLLTWGEAMPAHHYFGELFSVAFAIDRKTLKKALKVIFEAFNSDEGRGDFVVTLRFVKKCRGTLAFTRFDDNVVIDLDGMRTAASEASANHILASLKANGIPFCLHWGKLGAFDNDYLVANFGGADQPDSALYRWRTAREKLLHEPVRSTFANAAAREWGLI